MMEDLGAGGVSWEEATAEWRRIDDDEEVGF